MSGEEVRVILLSNGFVLKDIASKLGISPQAFNSRLSAKEIKLDTLNEICKTINKSLDYFIGDNQIVEASSIEKESTDSNSDSEYVLNKTNLYQIIDTLAKSNAILIETNAKQQEEIYRLINMIEEKKNGLNGDARNVGGVAV